LEKNKTKNTKMDFKVGFIVLAVFLVAAIVSTVVLACLYTLKNPSLPPTSNSVYARADALFGLSGKDVHLVQKNALRVGREVEIVNNALKTNNLISLAKSQGKQVIAIDTKPFDLPNISEADLVISSKTNTGFHPQLYVPAYDVYMQKAGINPSALVKTQPFTAPARAEFFAACVCSNLDDTFQGVKAQKKFLTLLQTRTDTTVLILNKDHEMLTRFRFVLAFEAASIQGFISKYLIKAFLAGAIPVYWGAPDVAKHFNPKRFLNVLDFESFDACIDEMLRIDSDPEKFLAMVSEACLLENKLDPNQFPLQLGGDFYKKLYAAVPRSLPVRPHMITSNDVHFVTFADGKRFLHTRVVKEAQESGYFDVCRGYGPSDLPPDFMEKFTVFVKTHRRGFGYWMWKPVVLQMALRAAKDNDIIVWCDSGSSVRRGYDRNMLAYYSALQGTCDVVGFEINHLAIAWTKADLYETLQVPKEKHALQLVANTIVLRKTASSVGLIDEWARVTQSDPHNLDDSPSRAPNHWSFKEHRHDQSCWDLLARGKKYPGLFVSRDNLQDDRYIKAPLVPTRKR